MLGDLQSLPSVRGHEDLIPTLLQNDLGQRTQFYVVIDHEDRRHAHRSVRNRGQTEPP